MPLPVSLTVMRTLSAAPSIRNSTRPPSGVNLMAFVSRFHTTCCNRVESPSTCSGKGPKSATSVTPFASAAERTVSSAASSASARSTGPGSIRSLPVTIRAVLAADAKTGVEWATSFHLVNELPPDRGDVVRAHIFLHKLRPAERAVGAGMAEDFVHPLVLPDGAVGLHVPLKDAQTGYPRYQ